MTRDLSKEREEACKVIVRQLLTVIGEIASDCVLGEVPLEEMQPAYQKIVSEKILPVLQAHNIRTFDLAYIMKMFMQPFDAIKTLAVDSITIAEDKAVAAKFGLEDHMELRLSHIIQAQMEKDERKKTVDNPSVVNKADLE